MYNSGLDIYGGNLQQPTIRKYALPIALTIAGVGALTLAAVLAARSRRENGMLEDIEENDGIENFDIVFDKPFIYAICE